MSARLKIEFANSEGALIRLLGLIERRGFMIKSVAMNEHSDGLLASVIVEILPRGPERSLEVLVPFVRRLHEIRTISVFEPMQDQAA